MGLLGLIVFGAIVGFVADLIDKKHANSWLVNVVLGIVGSLVGGFIRSLLTANGTIGFDFWSFLWALGGTLLVLFVYHAVADKRIAR